MSILCWNRRTKKTGRGSALPILLTAFMLAMALLPLVNPDEIAAKDDKPRINLDVKIVDKGPIPIDIDPGEVQVTPSTTPIVIDIEVDDPDIDLDPEIEVMPTETIEIDPDLDITAVPDQPATIFINKHGCPAGYDTGGKSFYDLAADCQAASNGIGFGLSDGNGFVQQQATGDLIGSGVQFDGVAAGPYSILEQVPAGYAAPRVFCESTLPGEGGQGANFVEQQVLEGNQIFHLIESGEFYYCDWFNIPGDKPTLHLPPGTVLDIDGDLPVIDLPDCVDGDETVLHLPDGVEIDVERRELTVPSDLIDLTERDRVIVADRDAWTTTITLPEGVDLIETEDGPAIVIPICDVVEEADAGGAISIAKSSCPIGFDAYAADVYGLALECNDPMADVTFLLSDGAQAISQSTTDANGAAGFTGVPNAPLSIVEQVPAGYGEPIVFCILNSPSQPQPGETVQQTVLDGNQIFIDFPENGDLSCSWYNVPALDDDAGDGEGVISISKTECPIGFDAYAADIYDLAYNCSDPMPGVTFLLSDGASAIAASTTDANGSAGFNGVDAIPVSIVEQVPDGFDAPRVFCISNVPGDTQVGDTVEQQVLDGNQIFHLMEAGESLSCTWFNIPAEDGGKVIVHKYECPDVPGINSDMEAHLLDKGCQTLDGIDFTLAYGIDTILPGTSGQDGPGAIVWGGLPSIEFFVTEFVPGGHEAAVVYCSRYVPDVPSPLGYDEYEPLDGAISATLAENEVFECWWINIPTDDGSITIIKYTCPEGYDWDAYEADPREDCKSRTNGIDFTVTGDGYGEIKESGSAGDKGKVVFADLPTGDYTVTESVPYGIEQVFVLECEGLSADWIQGYPLHVGNELELPMAAGDHIVCRWYNVPEDNDGEIEVTKYVCGTKQFVHASDCWLYEHGVDFALSAWNGSAWVDWGWDTTNAGGRLTFDHLEPGIYQIDEIGDEWCYASADRTNSQGYLVVEAGKTTNVDVWNCDVVYEYETPTKFPNTGAGQVAFVETALDAPVGSTTRPTLRPEQWMGVTDERLVAFAISGGERPVAVRIASVGIDATTETLDIVDGEMQDPTTADQVAWYKESAKLGKSGNLVLAGHLNYWGVPEGVFYRLADVQIGDEIVVRGDRGGVYTYRVVWSEPIDADTSELSEIVGPTDGSTLTLITCGGEWDPSEAEYNQRTVVRAELVVNS